MDDSDKAVSSEKSDQLKFIEKFSFFNHFVILLLATYMALLSLSEYSGRNKFLEIIQLRISHLNEKFLNIYPTDNDQLKDLKICIDKLKLIDLETRNLIANGVDLDKHYLSNLRERFRLEVACENTKQNSLETPYSDFTFFTNTVATLSSIRLFAYSMILSGIVGALTAALRAVKPLTLHAISLGTAAGFIVFLLILGGKDTLFYGGGTIINFSPFTGSFLGLLGGLFSDKLFELLKRSLHFLEKNS